MKAIFTAVLIMVLSPIAMIILSGLYFGFALWLTGGPGQFGALGEIVGRISFIVGIPAGAVVGLKCGPVLRLHCGRPAVFNSPISVSNSIALPFFLTT